jgi:hypothetical protein
VIVAAGVNGDGGARSLAWTSASPKPRRSGAVPAHPPRVARRQAGDLGCPRRHQGRRLQGAQCNLAALSRPRKLHAQCAWRMPAGKAGASSPPSPPPPSLRTTPKRPGLSGAGVADQLRPKLPKLAIFMDDAKADVLAYMTFSTQHRAKLHSTNLIERRSRLRRRPRSRSRRLGSWFRVSLRRGPPCVA